MKTVTKNESAVFGFGGWCCLMSGLFMFCAFSDRVPIILALNRHAFNRHLRVI